MVSKITESAIETFAIGPFEKLDYQYVYILSTASDSDNLLLKTMSGEVRVYL